MFISDHDFSLGAEDANRLLSSTATVVIRTEAKATGETHVPATAALIGGTSTTTTTNSSTTSSTTTH